MKAEIFYTLPNCDKNGITEEINLIYRQYRSRGIPWNRCSKEFYKIHKQLCRSIDYGGIISCISKVEA